MQKSLADFKDDIQKCSKCGLCMSVCPVYAATKNDCAVSRGKFIMLNGVLNRDLNLSKNINKYLDMCLKCNACKDFCPTGIDARKIFLAAKAEYFKSRSSLLKQFCSVEVFDFFMRTVKFASGLYRFLLLDKLAACFYPLLGKFFLGKKIIFTNKLLKRGFSSKVPKNNKKGLKAIYFKGCVNEYINPRTSSAVEYLLRRSGIEVIATHFKCCGAPFLSEGDVDSFKKLAEINLLQVPDDFDYFLTDCATCQSTFKDYENHIEDEKLIEKLKKVNDKAVNINDFIINYLDNIELKEEKSFTFHKPCHLDNTNFISEFLKKCKNAKYIKMDDFDVCCGFSGAFALKNNVISETISAKKANNSIVTNAQYLLTACPACLMGLNQGLIENGEYSKEPMNFVEFLAENIL